MSKRLDRLLGDPDNKGFLELLERENMKPDFFVFSHLGNNITRTDEDSQEMNELAALILARNPGSESAVAGRHMPHGSRSAFRAL